MDFMKLNEEIKKNQLMKVSTPNLTVEEAIQTLKEALNIQPLFDMAINFKITCDRDAKNALSMSMQARKIKKSLDESRKQIIRPHLDFQKAINTIVGDYTKTLEEIETNLKKSLETWIEIQSSIEEPTDLILNVADGKATQQTEYDFELEDISKVPLEYLILDEKAVKKAIKSGVRNISGIKISEKTTLKMRVKNG